MKYTLTPYLTEIQVYLLRIMLPKHEPMLFTLTLFYFNIAHRLYKMSMSKVP